MGSGIASMSRSTQRRTSSDISKSDQIHLDMGAFRLSVLDGSLPVLSAGLPNSPLDSRVSEPLLCTGVSAGIDYITVCFDCEEPLKVCDKYERILGVSFACDVRRLKEGVAGPWYTIIGSFGTSIQFAAQSGGGFRCRLTLGGRYCQSLCPRRVREFFVETASFKAVSYTRIDLRADDKVGILSVPNIRHHLENGGYIGYRGGEAIQSYGSSKAGETVYFGGRKSESRMRFYDKAAEQGVPGHWVRQELQYRGKRARQLAELILQANEEDIWTLILSTLGGAITLGTRAGKNLDRFKAAEFWLKWLELLNATPTKLPPIEKVGSVDRTLSWLARTASRALAVAYTSIGDIDFATMIHGLIQYGRTKIKDAGVGEIIQYASRYQVGDIFPEYHEVMLRV